MQPLISVIIPVYNVERYLELCFLDIIKQTYKNIEIIFINDGSTDTSGKICDDLKRKDKRVKVLHKTNGGLSDARNKGIEIASGNFFIFIDSDDRISEKMVDILYHTLVTYDAELAICDSLHIFDDREFKYTMSSDTKLYSPEEATIEMWYQTSFLPSACGKIYKTSLFEDLKFKEGIIFEDLEIMHKLFFRAKNIAYVPASLYGYVHRENSITTQEFSFKDTKILQICNWLLDYSKNKSVELNFAAQAYCVVGSLRVYLNAPRDKIYRKSIDEAIANINLYGKRVLKDHKIRRKTKYGLILYFYFKPLLPFVYSKVNRWN